MHREQGGANRILIAQADAGGHFRLAANLRQVQTSLDRIVPALEAIVGGGDTDAGQHAHFMVHAAKERHRTSVERVLEVLRRFDRDDVPVTFVAVAAAASVSRPWLYREPTLRSEILRCRSTAPTPSKPLVPAAQRASAESQQRPIETLNEELRSFRADNTRLRSQLERSLGEQRLATTTRRSMATISSVSDMSPKQTT